MDEKQNVQPLDNLSFRELALRAGFSKTPDVDTKKLAEFYGVNEITIKRWLKLRVCTPATMKLLKLHILQVEQRYWIYHFNKGGLPNFVEKQIARLDLHNMGSRFQYPIIKKYVLKKLINTIEWLYLKVEK